MNWPEIIQWLIAGGVGATGFKLIDLFMLRKPKQKTDPSPEHVHGGRREPVNDDYQLDQTSIDLLVGT